MHLNESEYGRKIHFRSLISEIHSIDSLKKKKTFILISELLSQYKSCSNYFMVNLGLDVRL